MTTHSLEPTPAPSLRSVHTENAPRLLEQLGISLAVTTYQANRLVLMRADEGKLNTHFREFRQPMGLALDGDRLAIGTGLEVWEYDNVRAVAERLTPAGKHDACFVPRCSHTTGHVQIHEMGWGRTAAAEPELWFVNTRFSCLCTLDRLHSFVPRWQPPFITALTPDDRCHLNGMCLVDGRPAFVTALGETDTAAGWRANKRDGGVLIEVETGEVLLRGLSMPHSPRWHNGRLWVLDSGNGGLGYVDPHTRRYERVAELPGFTRGLDFVGNLAFVGLSQVRESAVFSGIPIADRPVSERRCGVWVVDLNTGETVAYLQFEDALQEIFAVQVLHGIRYPDLVNDDLKRIADSFVLPDQALGRVPAELRSRAS
ncbi:TIGR03032 family protein [Anatilimnocola floriformis]|uniref:TIGR03032 family protein n=1 Tax=Anatilimnocola floriformis TaxID=2948575 RepID=UPI0020C3F72E|nr:TIGR03032 family protein [Anatilimnocola floriformis]